MYNYTQSKCEATNATEGNAATALTPTIIYSKYELKLINSNKALSDFISNYKTSSAIVGAHTFTHLITNYLNKKYLTSVDTFNVKVINDIIYNENTHIVSVFKDYLIFDDVSEFMKRYYKSSETSHRLPKIFEFYEKYSKLFPNYVRLAESKYMFKNIEKKQKLIDDKQKDGKKNKEASNTNSSDDEDNRIFDSLFLNKLNKAGSTFDPSLSAQSQLHSYIMNSKLKIDAEHTFQDLIDNVLSKDSVSFARKEKANIEKPVAPKKDIKPKIGKKSPEKKTGAKPFGVGYKEVNKEIKIQLMPNKKEATNPSQPTTAREYLTPGSTQEKPADTIRGCTPLRGVRTFIKTAGREPTPTKSTNSTRKVVNIDPKSECKRAHSSQKPSQPKMDEKTTRKIMGNIEKNSLHKDFSKESLTKTPIKYLTKEPNDKIIPVTTKNLNSASPTIKSATQVLPKKHNDFIIDIEVTARGNSNIKGDSSVSHSKKSQSQKPKGGALKVPEYTSPKIMAIQAKVNPPQTVKAKVENRMLFSKSVTRSDRAKGRLEVKTPSQNERKEFISIKLASAKVASKNIIPSNAFQPQGGTYKKYDFYMEKFK